MRDQRRANAIQNLNVGAVLRLAALACLTAIAACTPRPEETGLSAEERAAIDENHPGRQIYGEYCAQCHDNNNEAGAPTLESLRTLNSGTIRYALELGYMKYEARNVPKDDLEQLIQWLPRNESNNDAWIEQASCTIKKRRVNLDGAPRTATTFGLGPKNQRNQTADEVGLSKADMPNLELAWSVAFPNTPTMRSQPVIVGDTLFIATTDAARLYALDAETGCVKWFYKSDMTLRSSLSFAEATDTSPAAIILGDAAARVHAVNAQTGEELWVTNAALNEFNRITGAPVVLGDRVFAPLSAIEVNYTQYDDYECCKGQGAIIALDLATGEKLWTGRTMPEAQPVLTGRTGTQQWGPSGAIIWSTPAIDEKRNVLYAGTGENTSWPATETSDAVVAYNLDTGEREWSFQATSSDIWNYACFRGAANCDFPGEYHSPDFDFGGSALIAKNSSGRDLIVIGQKSGVVWAIDPDTHQQVWSNRIGRGSASGGIHWGIAFDGERIYAPINDRPGGANDHPAWGPGIHALDVNTGASLWTYKPSVADCGADTPTGHAFKLPSDLAQTNITAPMAPIQPNVWNSWTPAETNSAPPEIPVQTMPLQTDEDGRPVQCRLGMSPAPLVVDGAVVTGTTGGMLRIFDGETGDVLFEYQTNRPYETINPVPGHGGGLDSHPYVAANGTLYVQSGYARFGEPPGNVLLAFRPNGG